MQRPVWGNRKCRGVRALVSLLCLGLLAHPSNVSAECLLGPVALPGLSGPPTWFDPSAPSPAWRAELQDPRWSGSQLRYMPFSVSDPTGSQEDVYYRAMVVGTTLYVSAQVLVDPNDADDADGIYLAFTRGTLGNGAFALAIFPNHGGTPVTVPAGIPKDPVAPIPTGAAFINWYDTPNVTIASPVWTAHQQERPTWLIDDVATWTSPTGAAWGLTFKVDLSTLSAGDFKMFYGAKINTGAGVARYGSTPPAATDAVSINGETVIKTTATDWLSFNAPGSPCTGAMTLSSMDVGIWNGSAMTSNIQACSGTCTPTIKNQFRVTVRNVPTAGITQYAVRTRIRLADWGSTISDWKNAPWKPIPGLEPATAGGIFTTPQSDIITPPTPERGVWAWSFTDLGTGFGDAQTDFTCGVQGTDQYCPKITSTYTHQCMLVELSSAPGMGAPFSNFGNAAVYRNMDFQGLSSVEQPAVISLQGIKASTGSDQDRDVYLYVETLNLPAHGDKPVWLNAEAMERTQRYSAHPPVLPIDPRNNDLQHRATITAMRAGRSSAALTARAISKPPRSVLDVPLLTASQALDLAWPTYRVHVYYDTGLKTKVRGLEAPILQPMVPFTVRMTHDGALYGFTHALTGLDGLMLEEIAPNFYRVRAAKAESDLKVLTKVTAEEQPTSGLDCPKCPPPVDPGMRHCGCRVIGAPSDAHGAALLALLGAVIVGLSLRARRRRRQD